MSKLAADPRSTAESATAPTISIAIKALNEEAKIVRAIESALTAIARVGVVGEVVLADSGSSDRTVEIASRYPITIVQIGDPMLIGCGAAVELGFQHSRGTFVFLMDGDMAVDPDFIVKGLAYLETHRDVAGVAGQLIDEQINNAIDRIRVNNRDGQQSGDQPWLTGGGLYRRQAILASGGYAAHAGLRGYEEAELGLRLRYAGYRLVRLPILGVWHRGHELGTLALMARHWRSRRVMSGGVLLRYSLNKPWLRDVLWLERMFIAVALWWIAALLWIAAAPGDLRWPGLALFPLAILAGAVVLLIRKRDLVQVAASLYDWHQGALALMFGLFMSVTKPGQRLPARIVSNPASPDEHSRSGS